MDTYFIHSYLGTSCVGKFITQSYRVLGFKYVYFVYKYWSTLEATELPPNITYKQRLHWSSDTLSSYRVDERVLARLSEVGR